MSWSLIPLKEFVLRSVIQNSAMNLYRVVSGLRELSEIETRLDVCNFGAHGSQPCSTILHSFYERFISLWNPPLTGISSCGVGLCGSFDSLLPSEMLHPCRNSGDFACYFVWGALIPCEHIPGTHLYSASGRWKPECAPSATSPFLQSNPQPNPSPTSLHYLIIGSRFWKTI